MSTNKYLADLKRRLVLAGFSDFAMERPPGHIKLTIRHRDGRRQLVVASSSPSVPEHSVNNVIKDVQRFERGQYKT